MRHSQIITDLHYAKAKPFSGDPNSVAPDFEGELLVKTETKQLYVADSTTTGDISPLGAVAIGGDGAIQFGNGRPTNAPTQIGQAHIDLQLGLEKRVQYWAIRTGSENCWISDRIFLDVTVTFNNLSAIATPTDYRLLYADVTTTAQDPTFESVGEYPLTTGSPVSFATGYSPFNFALGGAIAFGFDLDPSVKVSISGTGLGGQIAVYQSQSELIDPISSAQLGTDFLYFVLDNYPYSEAIALQVDIVDR